MPEIISRADAKAAGLKRYYTGKPCKNGHVTERFVSTAICYSCSAIDSAKRCAANPEKYRDKARKSNAKARAANPEKHRERRRKARAANPEKYRESVRKAHAQARAAKLEAQRLADEAAERFRLEVEERNRLARQQAEADAAIEALERGEYVTEY